MKAKLAVRQPATAKVQRQTASVALARKPAAEPALRIIDGGLDGSSLLRLQAAAGNQAVGELIAQPPLSIQAFSLATLVRPAEFAAGASAAVGDAAGKEPDKEPTPAEMGEELKPKSGEAAAASAKADESAARTAAEVGDAAAAKAPATPQAPAKTPKAGPTAGGDGAAPGAGAAPEAEVEAESAPQPAVDAGGAAGAGASRPADPRDDPRFAALAGRVGAVAGKQKSHPPARAKVAETENAAKGPGNEVASKAAANKVEEMGAQKPKGFDKPAFIAAVHAAIEKKSPKNMTEVRDFKDSGKAAEIKSEVAGSVAAGKEAAAGDVKASAQAPPNPAGIAPKPVTPMAPEAPGAPPADVKAADAMPAPKPEAEVSLDHTKPETDKQLAEGNVTEEQVAESNEPQFHEAMDAKKDADEHAATAPKKFREEEQKQLGDAKAAAAVTTATGLAQMHQSRGAALGHVGTHKDAAKAKNEAARAKVAADIEQIYNATKKDVDGILGGIDPQVSAKFDAGEKSAREAFENDYQTKKDAYFDDRYSGLRGKWRWVKDKFKGAPPEVNEFINQAKQLYITKMEAVINEVANIVETELNRATARIAEGRKQITDYVAKQPKDLKQIAGEAAKEISSKFDALDQAVTDKASDVVDDLADKYVAAAKEVDDRCDAMREENKGLIDKAKDKIKGMIEAIGKIKDMLSQMADKAAAVIGDIIAHPIRFLGNLIDAVKQGFNQFTDKIGTYLEQGLMGWLLGELGTAGIQLPETFDLKGILHFVAQILGLTWENIRARAVGILGPEIVGMIEQGVAIFQKVVGIFNTIKEKGLAGIWEMIQDKIGDLKAQFIDQIQQFVITKVITAGVKWILGLLNPVGAFIKACMAIYDIVMFFINHGSEILALVNAILDSLGNIVAGNISAAANYVESVLAKAIPLVIGFLASLLGVSGIGEKIKEVIETIRKPINKAVDWVLKTVVKPVAKMAARAIGWVKGKVKSGVEFLKKKAQAGIGAVKSKIGSVFGRKDKRTPEERRAALNNAMSAGQRMLENPANTVDDVRSKLPRLKSEHGVKRLELIVDKEGATEDTVHLVGANSPAISGPTTVKNSMTAQRAGDDEAQSDLTAAGEATQVHTSPAIPQRRYLPASFLEKGVIRRKLYERGADWDVVRWEQNLNNLDLMGPAVDIHASQRFEQPWEMEARRAQVQAWIDAGKLPPEAMFAVNEHRFGTPWLKQWMATDALKYKNAYHIDHINSLAQHWVQGTDGGAPGHNGVESDRINHAKDPENLNWITAQKNLSKGSVDEDGDRWHFTGTPYVGPDFTSDLAEGGKIGAKTIDGESFRDEHGKALP